MKDEIRALEESLIAPIHRHFGDLDAPPSVVTALLGDLRCVNTRRAYKRDIEHFFEVMTGRKPSNDSVLEFLHLSCASSVRVVLRYKAILLERGLKEATVNRRLASIRALVAMGRKLGVCSYTLEDVKGETVQKYRDTTGIAPEDYIKVLAICDRFTPQGKRDYALLKLLWDNALRRNEVSLLNIGDFDPVRRQLRILGKGRGTQSEVIGISRGTAMAIQEWIEELGVLDRENPLFIALDFKHSGHRLTGDGIYKLVRRYCEKAGISKRMSPHRVRHSAITAALDATDGNVRKVQKFSRHKQIDTLMIYDDNRCDDQGELTELLSGLTDGWCY
jgi:integrase/recombinase XerC